MCPFPDEAMHITHPHYFPLCFACCFYEKAYSYTSWLFSWTVNPIVPLLYMFLGQMGIQITSCFQLGTIWFSHISHSPLLGYSLPNRQTFSSSFGCPLLNIWVWSKGFAPHCSPALFLLFLHQSLEKNPMTTSFPAPFFSLPYSFPNS